MYIIISNNSKIPVYEQIKNSFIKSIISGELKDDEALPSIRVLAKDIRISIMTIKKAYDELEREGFIVTKPGIGSFVAPKNLEIIKEQKQREIEKHLDTIIDIAKKYDISKSSIIELIDYMYKE